MTRKAHGGQSDLQNGNALYDRQDGYVDVKRAYKVDAPWIGNVITSFECLPVVLSRASIILVIMK